MHGPPIAVVIHTMAGTIEGCTSWFLNPASQVSAHYGVGIDGDFVRYINRRDTAWSNGLLEDGNRWPGPPGVNPNWLTVSIETEDLGNPVQLVTDAQYTRVRTLVRTVMSTYPSIEWLMGHSVITPLSRPDCPGDRWIASGLLKQLADEAELDLLV